MANIRKRSGDAFAQVDNYLIALKMLGIPSGEIPTLDALVSANNSAKIFFNTLKKAFQVYVDGAWIDTEVNLSDYYNKQEVDNLISGIINGMDWKAAVATYDDLATEYPSPEQGWTVTVNDESVIYQYDGSQWVDIGDMLIPMADATRDGRMSKEDFVKLRDIEAEATKNASDAQLRDRSTHTGEQVISTITDLQNALDGKLSIRGDNFIATRPGVNSLDNGIQFSNIFNELATFAPGGNLLSHTNRAFVLVFPGVYEGLFELNHPFIDIIGFGNRENIIFKSNDWSVFEQGSDNIRVDNIYVDGVYSIYGNTDNCVYRNISLNAFWGSNNGLCENITQIGDISETLFEIAGSGIYRNIQTAGRIFATNTNVSGIIEDCRADNDYGGWTLSGKMTRCSFVGSNDFDAIIGVEEGAEISYSTVINTSNSGTGAEFAVIGRPYYSSPSPQNVKIHHCRFEGTDGAIDENVINLITNGHNSWDAEGTSDGIEDIIEGDNISIDKTNPKKPVISSTGGGTGLTPEQEAKLENTPNNTIEELADKVDKEEGKGLSSNDYTSIEKDKLGNIESEAQKNVQSDWNQENSNSDDYIKNKPSLFSGSYNDLEDVPSSFPSTIEDVNGLDNELGNLQDQITINENKLEYVLNFPPDVLNYYFKETIDIKINSIKIEPESGQTVDLGEYILGETLEAYTVIPISVNKGGIIELIGERV